MQPKDFKIVSTNEYMWRWQITGASHNWVKCWHVLDSTGTRIAGGHRMGNNTQSGSPVFPRKRDAQAWIDGYCDIFENWDAYYKARGLNWSDSARVHFSNGVSKRKRETD